MFLLIVDEFHMMTYDQKVALLDWFQRGGFGGFNIEFRLLMISNRFDQDDLQIFEKILCAGDSHATKFHIVNCRGSVERFFSDEVFGKEFSENSVENMQIKKFFTLWMRSTRNLFGEELMSLRLKKDIHEYVRRFVQTGESIEEDITRLLQNKVPHLTRNFCSKYVKEFMKRFGEEKDTTSYNTFAPTSSGIHFI